jgi:hypothetical protein
MKVGGSKFEIFEIWIIRIVNGNLIRSYIHLIARAKKSILSPIRKVGREGEQTFRLGCVPVKKPVTLSSF